MCSRWLAVVVSAAACREAAVAISRQGLAFCIAGPSRRLPPTDTVHRLRHAFEVLGGGEGGQTEVNIFAVVTGDSDFVRRGQLPEDFRDGWVAAHVLFDESDGPSGLKAELLAANAPARASWLESEYARFGGNFLGPLIGADGRNAFLLRDLWRCSLLVQAQEASRAAQYEYWGFIRPDLHWLVPPPALRVFRQADPRAIWVPDGQDWDGINDRFALVPRCWAAAYFDRWPLALNGSLLPLMRRAAGGFRRVALKFDGGPEWLLAASLRWGRAPVRRFAPVGALLCPAGSTRGQYGRCTKPWPPTGLSFKYSAEASEAHANARNLGIFAWQWRASQHAPSLAPPCFESETHRHDCCSRSAGLNGDAGCWTDVYSFSRCCQPGRLGLWILPSAAGAAELELASQQGGGFCWLVVTAVSQCLKAADLAALSAFA